jgi:chromate transporter
MDEADDISVQEPQAIGRTSVGELAFVFLRLGTLAFGGPAAHVALMENEFVRRRRWLTEEKFLDLLGAVNLIPGPNSTEMAIHIGFLRAGWMGLLVAGICFILPAMLLVSAIAWTYCQIGSLPQFTALLYGVKPVIIAVILQALGGLGRKAVKTSFMAVIAVLATIAGFFGVDALLLILVGGAIAGMESGRYQERGKRIRPILVMLLIAISILAFSYFAARWGSMAEVPFGQMPLFLYFLKIGSVLYGSGYVLLAFLQTDLVTRWHWLSSAQLLDATAVGQVTPGPLFTTATFIGFVLGYQQGGIWSGMLGGILATVGIFLPSFVFIAISGPLIPRLRKSPVAGAFLDGVIVASLALMIVVSWQLGRAAIVDVATAALAIVSMVLLVRYRVNAAWLVLGGAIIGFALQAAGIGG